MGADSGNVLVWDNQTNAPSYIPLDEYQSQVDAGRVRPYEQTVVRTDRGGTALPATPQQGAAHIAAGEATVSPADQANQDELEERRAQFDNLGDKALTFAEGVADSVSLGLIHEHGEEADLRRDVDSGSAFAGELAGLAVALEGGGEGSIGKLLEGSPAARVARGSEAVGKAAADALLGEAKATELGLKSAARRAIVEGTQNAALAAGAATGHEVTDALIDDKDFAAEHVVSEAGFGALLGGSFGAAGALFGRAAALAAKRADIAAGGGVIDPESFESASVHDAAKGAIQGWDHAVEGHRAALGALRAADEAGELGPNGADFIKPRADALREVEAAQRRLAEHDLEAVLAGDDAKAVHRALGAIDEYGDAVSRLDDSMKPGFGEREGLLEMRPRQSGLSALDDFQARLLGNGEGFEKAASGVEGEENLGGVETPTSENKTNAGKAGKAPVEAPRTPTMEVSDSMIQPGVGYEPGRQPLQAFAHDVEHVAAGIPSSKLSDIHAEMDRLGGKPGNLPRFQELAQQAHDAGHLRLNDAGDLVKSPEFARPAGEPPPPFSKGDRFRNKGKGDPDTVPGKSLGEVLGEPTRRLTPDAAPPKPSGGPPPPPKPGATHLDMHDVDAEMRQRHKEQVSGDRAQHKLETAKTVHEQSPLGSRQGRPGIPAGGHLDQFIREMGPRLGPGDRAAAQVQAAMDKIQAASGGRIGGDMVQQAAHAAGLPKVSRGPLAEQLGNVWGLRQLARAAEDVAKGKATPLGKRLVQSSARAAGRAVVYGDHVGKAVAAHAGGVVMGHLIGSMVGGAAGLASSVGRARNAVVRTVDRLLNGRASSIVRATPLAAHYSYDGSEPTDNIHERLMQIQHALANPELVRQRAMKSLGDLAVAHPGIASSAAQNITRMLTNLQVRAPMFVWNALGDPRPAGERAVKQFREYEDVTNNPSIALDALARGAISKTQVDALREQYPVMHSAIVQQLLQDREALSKLPDNRLKAVESVLGMSLRYSGPDYVLRQQAVYAPPPQSAPQKGPGALKAPPATPAQALTAPGNR